MKKENDSKMQRGEGSGSPNNSNGSRVVDLPIAWLSH